MKKLRKVGFYSLEESDNINKEVSNFLSDRESFLIFSEEEIKHKVVSFIKNFFKIDFVEENVYISKDIKNPYCRIFSCPYMINIW
jgi:hypothetical protein